MFTKMWENEIFILGIFCERGAGVGLNRSRRSDTGGRGDMPPDRVRVQPHFCGRCFQRCRAPLSYRQAQSSGSGVITAGIWIIKAGICVIIPLPRVIKAGTRFIKQPYKPQRPPNYAPYSTPKSKEVKLPSERQTLSERLTGALRGCRSFPFICLRC